MVTSDLNLLRSTWDLSLEVSILPSETRTHVVLLIEYMCIMVHDCPQHTEGLVRYPETPAGTAPVPVTHQCAANANVSGSGLMCNLNGS